MSDINSAILERLEKVVDTLQDNSVKMGQILAVHNEKLDKQDKIDEVFIGSCMTNIGHFRAAGKLLEKISYLPTRLWI